MHHAAAVRLVHGGSQDLDEPGRFTRRLRPAAQTLFQVAVRHVLHRKERSTVNGADFIDLNQIRMLEPRDHLCLGPEPIQGAALLQSPAEAS